MDKPKNGTPATLGRMVLICSKHWCSPCVGAMIPSDLKPFHRQTKSCHIPNWGNLKISSSPVPFMNGMFLQASVKMPSSNKKKRYPVTDSHSNSSFFSYPKPNRTPTIPFTPHPSPTCLHDGGLREPLCFRMMCSTCTSSLPFIFLAGGSSLQPSCKMKPPSHQHGESLGKHAKIDRLLEMYRNAVMFEDVGWFC